ncbi:hypothetical protein SAMN04488602_13351, partial [Paenibacillus sp. cl123]
WTMEIQKCRRSFHAKHVRGKCTRNITREFMDTSTGLKTGSALEKKAQSRRKGMDMGWKSDSGRL